jgi:hypothetical protein
MKSSIKVLEMQVKPELALVCSMMSAIIIILSLKTESNYSKVKSKRKGLEGREPL